MIVLVDEEAHSCVCTDVRGTIWQSLGKFFTDKAFFNQYLALQRGQLIELKALEGLRKIIPECSKRIIHLILNLCQLPKIRTIGKGEPHEIARKAYTAGEHDIAVLSGSTEP